MSASLTGTAEVDDQPTPGSSCRLLEAQERLAEGPGRRWILGFSLEVENCSGNGLCCSVCVEEDGWLVLVLFEGCMGSTANCSGLGGNCRQMAGALGVGRPRGMAGGVWACQSAARRPMAADRRGRGQ